jgi:hypothetical protein
MNVRKVKLLWWKLVGIVNDHGRKVSLWLENQEALLDQTEYQSNKAVRHDKESKYCQTDVVSSDLSNS